MTEKLTTYGGQAVIEGVMMRGTRAVAIAMRAPNKEIVIHTEALGAIYKSRIGKIPFLRGLIALWDALGLGMRALTISANTQTGEDEKLEGPALYLTLGLALAVGIGLFFLLPAAIGQLIEHFISGRAAPAVQAAPVAAAAPLYFEGFNQGLAALGPWWGNLMEGIVRLLLLVGYIVAVGKIPDIRRVFAYHGAEHKTINAYEAGAELTPECVSHYSLEHPRCGTAFLLTLVLISVVLFSLLGPMPLGLRLASRILLLPVLAGMAYEYIRWTARHLDSPLVRLLIKPNLALQRLTTREPSLDMLEVSIAAFNAMRSRESLEKQAVRL
jgi:uncharacterized protein YqhQ